MVVDERVYGVRVVVVDVGCSVMWCWMSGGAIPVVIVVCLKSFCTVFGLVLQCVRSRRIVVCLDSYCSVSEVVVVSAAVAGTV